MLPGERLHMRKRNQGIVMDRGRAGKAEGLGRLFSLAMSLMAACALCMSFSVPWGEGFDGIAEEIVGNLAASFHGNAFISSLLALGIYWLSLRLREDTSRENWTAALLAALTAVLWLMGACFNSGGDFSTMCSSPGQIVKSIISYLGAAWFLYVMLLGFRSLLDSGWDTKLSLPAPRD